LEFLKEEGRLKWIGKVGSELSMMTRIKQKLLRCSRESLVIKIGNRLLRHDHESRNLIGSRFTHLTGNGHTEKRLRVGMLLRNGRMLRYNSILREGRQLVFATGESGSAHYAHIDYQGVLWNDDG
jgi:hypothetical protein